MDMERIQELVALYNECEEAKDLLEHYAGGRIQIQVSDRNGQPFDIKLPVEISTAVVYEIGRLCNSTMGDCRCLIENQITAPLSGLHSYQDSVLRQIGELTHEVLLTE